MKRANWTRWVAVGVLGGLFVLSWWWRSRPEVREDDGRVVLRLAHFQLEVGAREAFEDIARAYEALHPDVRVIVTAVPDRVYRAWMPVQLVGGTPPDILQLHGGVSDEMFARQFRPLTAAVAQPNPYLADTELAELPWRDTVLDGMQHRPAYVPALLEVYGIPNAMLTVRFFYNRWLWREIFGERGPPADLASWVAMTAEAKAWAEARGRDVMPFAGSWFNADLLFDQWFSRETQAVTLRRESARPWASAAQETMVGYLRGEWTMREPVVMAAWETMARAAGAFGPGFLQVGREDAVLAFVQERAVMTASGMWDYRTLRESADFEVGVFDVSLARAGGADEERGAEGAFGPTSEASMGAQAVFGVARDSRHGERAVDFLRFMSSREPNRRLTAASGWYPAVIGTPVEADEAVFAPRIEGYPGGLAGFMAIRGGASAVSRVVAGKIHLLLGHDGSAERFVAAVEPELAAAARRDLESAQRAQEKLIARQDGQLLAYAQLMRRTGEPSVGEAYGTLAEASLRQELQAAWLARTAAETAKGMSRNDSTTMSSP